MPHIAQAPLISVDRCRSLRRSKKYDPCLCSSSSVLTRNSSFRPQSEWDAPAKKHSEWDVGAKSMKKSEWDAGGKSSAGGMSEATALQAKKLKQKLKQIAMSKAKGGKPDYKAVFRVFDTEGSGQINRLEFKRGLEKLDFEIARDQMQQLQRLYFGGDGDNMISFAEFCIHAVDQESEKRRKQWEEEDTYDTVDYITCGMFWFASGQERTARGFF